MSNFVDEKKADERLGAYIARIRESHSMTVSDLAIATNLSEKNINLIEEGNWKAFPVQAYVRGYLNSISAKLGLDSKRVLDWYAAENGSKFASLLSEKNETISGSSSYGSEKSSKGKAIFAVIIAIGLALVVVSKFSKDVQNTQIEEKPSTETSVIENLTTEKPEMPEGAEIVPVDSLVEDSTLTKEELQNRGKDSQTSEKISQAVVDEAVKKSDLPASATIFLSSDSKGQNLTATEKTKIQLIASGEMRTWIGIKHREEDNEFLKESNLSKAGTRMVYEGADTLYIVVGESRAISKMILNGRELPLPGNKFGRVTRFKVYGGKVIGGAE